MNKKQLKALRKESRKWSKEEWEAYLKTIEHERSETLMSPKKLNKLQEKNPFLWDSCMHEDRDTDLNLTLKKALNRLTLQQKKVLKLFFWDNLTEDEIGLKMNRSRSTVRNLKAKGLKALRKNLEAKGGTLSPYIEGNFFVRPLNAISKSNGTAISNHTKKGKKYVA